METYRQRVAKLVQAVEAMPKPSTPEIGTTVWIPCAGIQAKSLGINIPKGHVGQIVIAEEGSGGKAVWNRTGQWISQQDAQSQYEDVIISSSHGHCPTCFEITESHE